MQTLSRPDGSLVAAIVSLVLAGCATSALEMAPDRPDQPWVPATDARGEIIPGAKAPPQQATGANFTLPSNSALGSVPAPPEIDKVHAYSLAELIDIAQSNNSLTRTAWNNARAAALAAGIAKSAYLPNLTASVLGGYQRSHGNNSAPGLNVSGDNTADGVVSALSLQWLLFDFGERTAVLDAARQVSVISNIAFTAAHQQVIYQVSLAYYTEGAARARVDTAARSLKNAETVQVAAEERHAHGVGTVVEVAQARQVTAQAQLLKVQAEGAAEDAYLALISAMGISPLTRIKIADIPERKLPNSVSDSVEHIVADALGRRPDVLAAYAAERASQENVRAARAEFMPKVFLSATGAYNDSHLGVTAIPGFGQQSSSTTNLTGNRVGVTVFVGITVPIYDGGLRKAVLEQARAKEDNARVALTHTREEAVRQIVIAENGLRTSVSAYGASTSLNSAAETTFEAAFTAYRNGVGSITDVTVAESQLLQAKNATTDAYSAALSAAATLALSVGSLGSAP
jgi:outer membrane protein TolC